MAKMQKQQERSLVWLSSYMFFRIALHGLFLVKALQFNAFLLIPGCVQMILNLFWFRRWWYKFSHDTSESPMVLVLRSVLTVIIGGMLLPIASLVMLPGYTGTQAISIVFMSACVFIYICHTVTHLDSTTFIAHALQKKNIIYNITWEDPSVEIRHCGMKPGEVILTISSAGCNIMDYLIEKPEAVVAADMNIAQLALLDLKLAAASVLEQEDFFNLFGISDAATFHKWYPTKLRPLLQLDSSRSFWDERADIFENNLMYAGESGSLAYIIHILCRVLGVQTAFLRIATGQKDSADSKWSRTRRFFNWFCFKFGARIVKMCCGFAGVPGSQWDLMQQNIGDYVDRIWEIGDQRVWIKGNYFFTGYVMGCFLPDSCPRYMHAQHFATVKAHVGRVKLFFGTWAEAAQTRDDFSFISLLDSMDWMTNEQIASSLSDVVKHTRADARLFWRSAYGQYSVHSPILSHLDVVPLPCGNPSDPAYDRVGFYLSQWCGSVREGTDLARYANLLAHRRTHAKQYANTIWGDMQVCYQMVLHATRQKKDSVQFYKEQGPLYDGFRENLLPMRGQLFTALPTSQPIKRWLSVGCGTARDLEFIFEDLKHWGTEVVLVDLSPELLVMARERVQRLGMQSQVSLIEGNFLEMRHVKLTPGSFDLVSCSYCLTMIPQWPEAVEKMVELLQKDGSLGITDFTVTGAQTLTQKFYKWWFSNDGVFMNREHVDVLCNHAKLKTVYYKEEANRVPYTPLWPSSYVFHGRRA
jgi:S-adenosylmethionine:diacylglycerol 3-amino-3-carboxypropyl transferase/ubiquinone/menaquinone biosynthesis C-methylase UbiE